LLGLEFFEKVVALEAKYKKPHQRIENDLQTNGTLLDDDWAKFLKQHRFVVGLSCDGPKKLHDHYRVTKGGAPTHDKVMAAARLLKKHGVPFNGLCVVNRHNARFPLDVYRFLTRELGVWRVQLISCVEPQVFRQQAPQQWDPSSIPVVGTPQAKPGQADSVVTDWSVDPDDWGYFLCRLFDRWASRDIGKIYVNQFETLLAQHLGLPSQMCVYSETCGKGVAVEHDGSLYSCDHYVYPANRLGNVVEQSLAAMAASAQQREFGENKMNALPRYCRECEVLFACNGECPKNRFVTTPDGECGLNYLCAGLRRFFNHVDPFMRFMAKELRAKRPPANVMSWVREQERSNRRVGRPGRNDPCPCGSGRKYKKCCGGRAQPACHN
jgi:uncharacterized protein